MKTQTLAAVTCFVVLSTIRGETTIEVCYAADKAAHMARCLVSTGSTNVAAKRITGARANDMLDIAEEMEFASEMTDREEAEAFKTALQVRARAVYNRAA